MNRQGWKRLEEDVRAWAWERAEVIVYVGPVVGADDATIGMDRVALLSAFWKVIVDPSRADAISFIVPQSAVAKADVGSAFEVPVVDVEAAARVLAIAGVDRPLSRRAVLASRPRRLQETAPRNLQCHYAALVICASLDVEETMSRSSTSSIARRREARKPQSLLTGS